jgi:putative drug exporter of the RND superfamily
VAALLYRLGRLAFRRRWWFVAGWLVVFAAVGFASNLAGELPGEDRGGADIEAARAFDLLQERFPGETGNTATARIVFVAENVKAHDDVIARTVDQAAQGSQVATAVRAPAVSEDGTTAYAIITYTEPADDLTDATREQLQHAVDRARDAGLTVDVGGPVLAGKPKVGGVSEIVGVGLAALVLLITFGSLAAAGMPLLTALLGVGVSTLAIFALGTTFGLSTNSSTLATMLGLAVGIDYALFVVSRYREERVTHAPQEAAARAVGTAGSAVVFAGLTVIIALAGLTVLGLPAAAKMGLAAAGAIVVAVLIALTLIPALLSFWPNAVLSKRATQTNTGSRWARFVLRHPVALLVAPVIGLTIVALPALDLRLGMPGDEAKSTETTERRAYDELARAFGPGFNGPLTIVVDARGTNPQATVRTITTRIADTPGVVAVSPARFNKAGDTALFTATPSTAPTSEETKALVQRIRDERRAPFMVTGTTAVDIDTADQVQRMLLPYLALVFGLAFLLLLVVFRSLLIPLKAVLGFLLSVFASLGVVVTVFQWGWLADLIGLQQTGPIISMMPIVLVGINFGLAMDYEVFLVTRMREAHLKGEPAREAVVTGFRHSSRIVTAAALIMIAVFAGFVGADLAMIKMIGFGLAVAILLDAFVVRTTIVPAVLALLGERAWWLPRWLDRLIPHLDIDGHGIIEGERQPEDRSVR